MKNDIIDYSLINNAAKPVGDRGVEMIDHMNAEHEPLTLWGFSDISFGKSVLDIGCGGGNALRLAAQRNPDSVFTGIDYSPLCADKATALNRTNIDAGRMTVLQASVAALPFADASFDTVYSVESYYFWPDLAENFREVLRVIKPGGSFTVIVEMVGGAMSDRHAEIAAHLHMTVLSAAELTTLLQHSGFCECTVKQDTEKHWLCVTASKISAQQ